MNITATAVAVTLAVVVAVAFLFFGPSIFTPFGSATTQTASTTDIANTQPMATSSDNLNQGTPSAQTPQKLPTTLTVTDEVVGTGVAAKAGDTVAVNYVGMLPDGTVFDASARYPETKGGFVFQLGAGRVISGWDQGLVGMKVGGKRQLIIPPDMAYGPQGQGPIPPNATLIFEVELVKIGQ
ncbi:MAG: fbp [Parcubacteria group bacterium]|nr:fbp [Parcubacteria group bacterium]